MIEGQYATQYTDREYDWVIVVSEVVVMNLL